MIELPKPGRSRLWRALAALSLVCVGALGVAHAAEVATPAAGIGAAVEHRRPSIEERRSFEKRMQAIHPNRPGCFEAHFPEERWIETPCQPAPRFPNPRAIGPRPNTVGDGTGFFAQVTSGNISQAVGSFDSVANVSQLYGFKNGDTSTAYPNVYTLQMNANTFSTTVGDCNKKTNCAGWEQFILSQSQCSPGPCIFIEYWLLNYPKPCPTNASWNYYAGTPTTTPGCWFNTPSKGLSAIPLTDLGSVQISAQVSGGNDIVTASDASGTLGTVSNPSQAGLGSGWTTAEYNLFGDCCAVESYFTGSTNTTIKVRVAVANGTNNAPNCVSSFSGTTAETNNLSLTGGCTTSGGTNPAIVFTETGGGSLPPGVSVGDPHLTTFHGAHYDFQHAGEYILAKADPDFEVQVRQNLITPPNKPAIAVNTGAAIRMGADRVSVAVQGVDINGARRAIADGQVMKLTGDVVLARRGAVYTMSRSIGDVVQVTTFGDHVDVSVTIGATNADRVTGLLVGGDDKKPLLGRDHTVFRNFADPRALHNFVESWRIEAKESLFGEEGRPTPSGVVTPMTLHDMDAAKVAQARAICTARGVKDPIALDDCTLDVAETGKPEWADAHVVAPKIRLVVK